MPTPQTVDDHKKYGSLKLQAGLGAGIAIAFFGAAYANEGFNLLQIIGGAASTFWAASRNSAANDLSDGVEQQMLTSYTRTAFQSTHENKKFEKDAGRSAEGRPLKDITPKDPVPV